ncbi:hypothetical protein CONCODRAFT_86077 [Conidiobolus coronatus NRRL 28638]|uniref:UTP23 sensor motif region domain-containing protein n=1 Tax=Conidiobolus coronatus (strain ATCC 28846 / CBS 209.66 / NRRL 28638) TaxID=796925 RepID=A0A137P2I7_CONC2|nr:hypothetical protein CONCODRAFT_86077 [Conidiobolus coronatus NRRL 28638]|eukprot:KXN69131.1 hypothetical protein CONCODRAFT_86077 [Conidiobolus coronatus NRRL 28638]
MKAKRIKGYKKEFKIYQTALKFKTPYNLIVEPAFISLCLAQKINLKERLEEIIGSQFKLISSSCVSSELKKQKLFNKFGLEYKNLKLFNRKCSHNKTESKECILSQIDKSNSSKFIVLSSDLELNTELQKTCQFTPIFSVFKGIVIMSPINDLTKQKLLDLEKKKSGANTGELKLMEKRFDLNVEGSVEEFRPKKKKAKGPNPLSVKKKSKGEDSTNKDKAAKSTGKDEHKEKSKHQEQKTNDNNKSSTVKVDSTIENSIEQEIKQIQDEGLVEETQDKSQNSRKRKRKHKSKKNSNESEPIDNNNEEVNDEDED